MPRILLLLSILWAVAALIVQVRTARGAGRHDYSRRAGSPLRGLLYAFTTAMLPTHKESVRQHPTEFAIGVVMHVGVLAAMLAETALVLHAALAGALVRLGLPVFAIALVAALALFVRRVVSQNLRGMSTPDDYLAVLASAGLLVLAALYGLDAGRELAFALYGTALFAYLPLGKLRHAVFFFVARGDYGRRLGFRGVWPPAGTRTD